VFGAESRVVETPAFFSVDSAMSARPTEYGSWKSISYDLLHMKLVDHEPRVSRALDVVARDNAEERGGS